MKKLVVVVLFISSVHAYDLVGCRLAGSSGIERVKKLVDKDIDRFSNYVSDTLLIAVRERDNMNALQEKFLQARLLYKKLEWFAEYFMPATTRFVNGPPLPEIENEENKIFEAEGLQVTEALIYTSDSIHYPELERQVKLLLAHSRTYKKYWAAVEIDSSQVLDAVKLQVFRIITLGISGFDAPLAKSSLREAVVGMQSLKAIAGVFYHDEQLDSLFEKAVAFISANHDFDSFDRLSFIKAYCDPLTSRLVQLQQQHGIAFVNSRRLLKPLAASLFGDNVFDVNAYTPDSIYFITQAKIILGKKLFNDPVLSRSNIISCAACHDPATGFTDGLIKNVSLDNKMLRRNTPTLLNAALQPWQFYDMRITNLENQSRDVIENKEEMHGNLANALTKLGKDSTYLRLFADAFPKAAAIGEQQIQNAIASYVRSLSLLNSRFDLYMRNKKEVELTMEEKNGFNLFMGKAKCGTCHFAPLFNGTVPPSFIKMESEVIGVPADAYGKKLDDDPGRYAIYALAPYNNAFKTTTVRNVALTAPYMHNGVFRTLEEVIDFYDKGGGLGLGLDVPNQTLPPDKIGLTPAEKKHLIAFLKTLTDSID